MWPKNNLIFPFPFLSLASSSLLKERKFHWSFPKKMSKFCLNKFTWKKRRKQEEKIENENVIIELKHVTLSCINWWLTLFKVTLIQRMKLIWILVKDVGKKEKLTFLLFNQNGEIEAQKVKGWNEINSIWWTFFVFPILKGINLIKAGFSILRGSLVFKVNGNWNIGSNKKYYPGEEIRKRRMKMIRLRIKSLGKVKQPKNVYLRFVAAYR